MAITPNECTDLEAKEKAKVIQLEKYIDDSLKRKFIKGNHVDIIMDEPSKRVFKTILEIYKEAGWTIEIVGRYTSTRNEPSALVLRFVERK